MNKESIVSILSLHNCRYQGMHKNRIGMEILTFKDKNNESFSIILNP